MSNSSSDRQTRAHNGKYSILTPQIQDIHIRIIPETVAHPCQYTGVMENHLLLYVPWCTAITGKCNSQLQANKRIVTKHKSANKYKNHPTNNMCNNSSMLILFLPCHAQAMILYVTIL